MTAARLWADYSGSGSIVTPSRGFVYAPAPELSLGVSWGRSFKMPTLNQQYSGYTAVLLPVTGYDTLFPPGSTYLYIGGPNPDVGPDRSEHMPLSVTFQPPPRLQNAKSLFPMDSPARFHPPLPSPHYCNRAMSVTLV